MPRFPKCTLSVRFFLNAFLFSACSRPSHSPLFLINLIKFKQELKFWRSWLCRFFPASTYLLPHWPKLLSQHYNLEHPNKIIGMYLNSCTLGKNYKYYIKLQRTLPQLNCIQKRTHTGGKGGFFHTSEIVRLWSTTYGNNRLVLLFARAQSAEILSCRNIFRHHSFGIFKIRRRVCMLLFFNLKLKLQYKKSSYYKGPILGKWTKVFLY
jgi:hypothetical protein